MRRTMTGKLFYIFILSGCLAFAHSAWPSDWPWFQGPGGNNISAEKKLLHSFPPDGPKIPWSVEVGPGFGGCSVHRGEVFIFDRVAEMKDVLRCLDLDSGKPKWTFDSPQPGKLPFPGSRTVPTVTDASVFCISGFGRVLCISRATRKPTWELEFKDKYSSEVPKFGYSHSPVIRKDHVIVAPLAPGAGLVALDQKTGDEVWKSPVPGNSSITSSLVRLGGIDQLVFISCVEEGRQPPRPSPVGLPGDSSRRPSTDGKPDNTTVYGIDPENGAVLWSFPNIWSRLPIPNLTKVADDRLFVTEGYGPVSVMLKITEKDGAWSAHEEFRIEKGSQIHPAIFHEGYLYLLANAYMNQRGQRRLSEGGLMCLDLDGRVRWRTGDQPNLGRGCMLLADGMLISQDGRTGHLRLIDPNPEKFIQLAEADLFGSGSTRDDLQMWSPMALSDGRLLMRSQALLLCVDLRVH
jgi:outer membrane protein assembly factor BamB